MAGVAAARPDVSVVVVVYDIPREAERTLYSLSAAYQKDIPADAYEVIVVDNGSTPSFDHTLVERLPGNFRVVHPEQISPSPAKAINHGLRLAQGETIGVMIDGARIATPGLLHFAHRGVQLFERSVVVTLGWHLGFDSSQRLAMDAGYDRQREDALLESIAWPHDGYRLFEIAALDPSSINGWLSLNGESNALFLRRQMWELLGGVEERFDAPGGGLLNLDTFARALELPDARPVVLLGEATFHQVHGGVATNADANALATGLRQWSEQYLTIRGRPWPTATSPLPRTFLGQLPRPALTHFVRTALQPVHYFLGSTEPPLGGTFDASLWTSNSKSPPEDPVIAALVALAQREFAAGRHAAAAAVARLARAHAPDEAAVLPLLAHASPWFPGHEPPADQRAQIHAALGEAHRLLGHAERATAEYRSALAVDGNLVAAHLGLSLLRMPGDDYAIWLRRLHEALRPEVYVEIGVYNGHTLALAQPPTRAFGIDPCPSVTTPLSTETHIFAETSDTFFAHRRPTALDGRTAGLAFIDGLHEFEQSLRDFMNVESWCGPASVVLLHDTVPLDEPTQRRTRETVFWTGEVWKTIQVLQCYRPDLDIFTIATAPTGLTVITGLDPSSRVLHDVYDEAVKRFVDQPFSSVEHRLDEALNVVPNDWEFVAARLRVRGVLPSADGVKR